ncbi:transposase [Paraburkholderia sp. CI3]
MRESRISERPTRVRTWAPKGQTSIIQLQLDGRIQIACLPPYGPDMNPVEYLWAWLKRHALANYCPNDLGELHTSARNKLKNAQKRPSLIAACWMQATLR